MTTSAIPEPVAAILRDPVSLEPIPDLNVAPGGYFDLRPGDRSAKNTGELEFALNDYAEPDGSNYVERLPHMAHPEIDADDIVVDIGCGPRSFLDGLPGHHVFVDDILGDYVDHAGARYDGVAVHARTELLPFADASVDIVYSVNMLDHVDDMAGSMVELARVLRPGGCIALQTYFNSHPLLPTEPGVFDRYFFDHHVLPYFEARDLSTHCVQSPTISDYYTMGILTATLIRRDDLQLPERDRHRIAVETGPQSLISEVLDSIVHEDLHGAEVLLAQLDRTGLEEFHGHLLDARLATAAGNLGVTNDCLARARRHPRAHRNPYARVAIMELESDRLSAAARANADRLEEAQRRHAAVVADHTERDALAAKRIDELQTSISELKREVGRRGERITALEDGFERRAQRILELTNSVAATRDRNGELQGAVARRDARIAELDGAIVQRDSRIAELDAAVAGRDQRIRELRYRQAHPSAGDLARVAARLPRRLLRKVSRSAKRVVRRRPG